MFISLYTRYSVINAGSSSLKIRKFHYMMSTYKQTTTYAGEVSNIQIEKTITNNGRMNKSNTHAATIEIPIRGIRTRLFWTSGRRP
jgi:acetate kinase